MQAIRSSAGKRAQPPRPWRGRWQGMARAGFLVLACAFASAGQAQMIQARDLDDAVSKLVGTLVNVGRLAGQAVYVGSDDFFEEENELRPPLSGILRTRCLRALTDRQVGVVLVPGDAARVLHGRWRRESETHLHLTLFIAEPPRAREEPVALVSADARVPVEGLRSRDIEPTLRHWGERVVRRLERDLRGSGRFGVHLSPFPFREGLSEDFGRYLLGRWRPAFTASDRFMLVGDSSSAEGVLHGEVFVADGRVEVNVHIEDGQGNSVAADHVALEDSLFPPGMVTGGKVAVLLKKCASYERRDLLTEPRGANAVECYREVLEVAPGNPTAQAGLDSIREQYAGEVQGLIAQGKFDAARAKAAQLDGVLSSEDPWTRESEEWIETAQARYFIERAEEAIGRGEFDEARTEVGRLAELSAKHPRLSELREKIEKEEKKPGRRFRDCDGRWCPELVVVAPGEYRMGSPPDEEGRDRDEGPVQDVSIGEALAVGVYEVTFEEWDACVRDGGCGGYRPKDRGWGRGRRPVINVSWEDAQAYVRWLRGKTGKGYRLLSESEWEYVARAGTETAFHTGETISTEQANYNGNHVYGRGRKGPYRRKTVEVGSFGANGFGLHDVHGNVREWVEDCWNGSYEGAPRDGSAWTRGDCGARVLRGGSWNYFPRNLRSADRYRDATGFRYSYAGFRIVRTL